MFSWRGTLWSTETTSHIPFIRIWVL